MMGLLLLAGCGDSAAPSGSEGGPASLSGTIREQGSTSALAGATVTLGSKQVTSDAEGHFELAALPVGAASVTAERPGYQSTVEAVTLTAGTNTHDFVLTPQEIYRLGNEAAFVPRGASPLRGAIIVLGGPVTYGFVTGDSITAGSNNPALEVSLQSLGAGLRGLATTARVALLGSRSVGLTDDGASDNVVLSALSTVATDAGHPELADSPLLLFGLSAGAREAAGLAARHPERAIGLLVRVPAGVTSLNSPATLAVPTFVMQAQQDAVVSNSTIQTVFAANRAQGGLWALAVEPGVGHSEASELGNAAALSWLRTVMELRLPSVGGSPLIALTEASGWLGNQTTLDIASWADYAGSKAAASWILSEAQAESWKALGTDPDTSGGGQSRHRLAGLLDQRP